MDIRALAAHLQLSIGTVSRALNGRSDVSPTTRARVIAAAKSLGYAPNQAGRSLRRRSTGTVAFILPLAADSIVFGDPFFLAVLEGVQCVLEKKGLELVVLLSRAEKGSLDVLERHLRRGIADAWILAATQQQDARISLLSARGIPFATLGRSETAGAYPRFDLDFEAMVDQAMARLLAAGHRRIALITSGPNVNFSYLAIARYGAALACAGLPLLSELIYAGPVGAEQCDAATEAMLALAERPSAIFVMSETGPVGVYAALRRNGLTPGRDIAVIGQRMTPACAALVPSLACFDVALGELGQALAQALVSQIISGSRESDHSPVLWPMTFVEGGSVS